jgi:glycosyltransferase involved in cell wall biosynthesis
MFTVDVLNILKQRGFKFKMLFVGTGPDVDMLKDKLDELKLTNDVIICGQITDRETLKAIYNRADLFIFPSLFDASSLVQVEAASQKTPTIFIERAVTANTITNNFNGFTAPNDTTLFANRIEEIFHNKELYSKVCENAYSKLYRTWDNIAKETYSLYLDLINERSKPHRL